jgi:hypothetical protein
VARRVASFWVNAALVDRLEEQSRKDGRARNSIVEQALAEYLNVPLADRDLPEQAVELCPNCLQGVLNEGRCRECRWRRDPRASYRPAVRARVQPNAKYAKRAKEAA